MAESETSNTISIADTNQAINPRPPRDTSKLTPAERAALETVKNAKVEPGEEKLSLGNSSLSYTMETIEGKKVANIEDFTVSVQGFGVGTRLMSVFRDFCYKNDVDEIRGFLISEGALRTRLKVFGQGVLEYYYKGTQLPITDQQALQSLRLGEQRRDEAAEEYKTSGIERRVDYGIDTRFKLNRTSE